MGLQIGDIVLKKAIGFKELRGKIIAVDALNVIYQFLSTIRQPDGTPLMDKQGRVTSHLSGLFYRNINLLREGIKLVYVFDGKPPELKGVVREKRDDVKAKAKLKYEEALAAEDVVGMGKYAKQMVKISDEMLDDCKELLGAMGVGVVQGPGEGEAQASYMARTNKNIYAVASQDYDCLLFKAPRLIQNLTLAKRRKTVSGYTDITPEVIDLDSLLNHLQINQEQLVCLGILAGTDYNPKGILGIGQKKALSLVREKKQAVLIFKSVEDKIDFDWKEIFELFHKPDVKDVEIEFPKINEEKIRKILLEHDFSEVRIENQLEKLRKVKEEGKQRRLF